MHSSGAAQFNDIAVVINPVSCTPGVDEQKRQIAELLRDDSRKIRFLETTNFETARPFAEEAVHCGADLVIAAGGDGTIGEAINGMIGSQTPLGIIPLGTGNLLAINLGIPIAVPDAITTILSGHARRIDLIAINGESDHFAVMGGLGFDARIMHETNRSSKLMFGKLAYFWTALQNLSAEPFSARVFLDNAAPIHCNATGIMIGNMGLIGPGVSVFPDADPEDGFLEVGILKAANAVDFARLMATAVTEGHPEKDVAFDIHRAVKARIELDTVQPLELDGDQHGAANRLEVEVLHQAVRILCPGVANQ